MRVAWISAIGGVSVIASVLVAVRVDGTEPPSCGAACPTAGKMAKVPGGKFSMGSNDPDDPAEKPVHEVEVTAFSMDITEVTTAQYAACVRATVCLPAATDDDPMCNGSRPDRKNHPANCVDWAMANTYCHWTGRRLPTEEEWEYAARGTDGRRYPWGNEPPTSQLCWKREQIGTCEVGSHPAGKSAFGLQDMAGNVYEWTASGHSRNYSQPRSETTKAVRGGGYMRAFTSLLRATNRAKDEPTARSSELGFRCAK